MATRVSQIQARVANRQVAPLSGGTTARRLGAPRVAGNRPAAPGWKPKAPNLNAREGIGPGVAVGGPGAGGAPGAPSAPTPLAQRPWNAQLELSRGAAEKGYGDKVAGLGAQRLVDQQQYGLDPGFNDYANNPFSRAALLRKSWDTNVRGDTNSFAGQGQLYAGSLANAHAADRGQYDQGYDALSKDYLATLSGLGQEEAQAREAKENAFSEAGWRALEAAQREPVEPVPLAPKGGKKAPKAKKGPDTRQAPKGVYNQVKAAVGKARKAR